jgi:uncharacterized protein (TIGR03084 family)
MADAWQALLDDIEAESRVLQDALSKLPDDAWDRPSPAEGWLLRDCVVHLAETDDSAVASVTGEPAAPRGERQGVLTPGMVAGRARPPAELLAWYTASNARMLEELRKLKGDERLPWAGRPMGARSFATARLMEHWSHGLDILDAAGIAPVDTDRLRNIAHLGYMTRDYAYRTHGMEPPITTLYLELTSPSGATWTWGSPDAPDRITGPAGDFCRVVTQRIHPDDTALHAEGPHAREFLSIAQAFAGPPGSGRPPKGA